jgi:DNA-binding NarL/FixJ family response regulator
MTTLLIADDQALVCVGLRKILESEPEMTVIGEAADGGPERVDARLGDRDPVQG